MISAIIKYNGRKNFVVGFAMAMALGVVGLWWMRYRWGDQLLWPVLLTCLVVLFLAVTSCLVIIVRLRMKFGELRFSESQPLRVVHAGCVCSSLEWQTPALMHLLSWSFGGWKNEADGANCLKSGWEYQGKGLWKENLNFSRRGHWHEPVRILHVGDALGLWKMQLEFRLAGEEYYVMPSRCCTPRDKWSRNFVTGEDSSKQGKPEGDRIDYRLYQTGDSARYLAWKLMARRCPQAPLLVRNPETVESPSVGFFFLPGDNDEAAARLMVNLLEKGPFGPRWFFSLPGKKREIFEGRSIQGAAAARKAIAESANFTDDNSRSGATIEWFTKFLKNRAVGLVIIVTGPNPKAPNQDYLEKPPVYGRHTLIADEQAENTIESVSRRTDHTLIGITVEKVSIT